MNRSPRSRQAHAVLCAVALTCLELAAPALAQRGSVAPIPADHAAGPFAAAAAQPGKPAPPDPNAGVVGDQIVGPGYRRTFVTQHQPISPEALLARAASGKPMEIDPATGDLVVHTFVDRLPAKWLLERPADLPPGVRVDSLGNPIVNETAGLPAWAQRDVDALRAAIVEWRDRLARDRAEEHDVRETEGILGNFVGQAITRAIPIDDIANIDDPALISGGLAASVLDYLHFYENIRSANQSLFGYTYTRTSYPARVAVFAARHGADLAMVQALEPMNGDGMRGITCYSRTAFARGMTLLTGQTDIWVTNGFDDASADISTGFPMFFFYDCADPGNNDMVRVSTNGYLTLFQQGGGSLDGTDFTNDGIPSAVDPDGYIAPWWDDLFIEIAQGTPDRVSYKTEGAADARVFTVEWFSVSTRLGSTSDFHYFQVKLYETTSVVELHFDTLWATDSTAPDSSTTGLENYAGTDGNCGLNCLNTNSAEPTNNYRFTPLRPSNDLCADATDLTPGAFVTGNLRDATADGTAGCGASNGNRDVWYTYTAVCNGTLTATTCGSRDIGGTGLGADTVLSIHSACPGTSANQLACSDDAGVAGCSGNDSAISLAMTSGQTVLIRVTHFGDLAFRLGNGAYQLRVFLTPATPAANDNCASAITVTSGSTAVGNLRCASGDGAADCGSSDLNNDIWYVFNAARPGTLTVDACGSRNFGGADAGPDCVISIHSGCPGTTANQLVCNDDGFQPGCHVFDSRVRVVLLSPGLYRIRVSHFGSGVFRIGNGATFIHPVYDCAADWDNNGQVQPADVSLFVSTWFNDLVNGTRNADFDGNGVIQPSDVSLFVTVWFNTLTAGGC